MDLARIQKNLEWNDSGEASRNLRDDVAVSRVVSASFAEREDVCRSCLVGIIHQGDEVVPTGLPEGGFYKVHCECAR